MPAFTHLALPETGAAIIALPSDMTFARISSLSSLPIDEQSTSVFGKAPRPWGATPSAPKHTSSRSLPVLTMAKSTSTDARSDGLSTMVAPSAASGSALAFVRFHTLIARPDFSSRSAMAKPMRPIPIQPMVGVS